MCNRKGQESKEAVEYRFQVQLEQPRQATLRRCPADSEGASSIPPQTTSEGYLQQILPTYDSSSCLRPRLLPGNKPCKVGPNCQGVIFLGATPNSEG